MNLRSRVVAVTGAGGFIGSALVRTLNVGGARVRALSGPPNEQFPPFPASVAAMSGEITSFDTLLQLCAGAEMVVHMAGPPSVSDSFDHASEYARIHVLGAINVLRVCHTLRIRRFIYISSAEVYGRPQRNPVTEEHPVDARSPYGACKIAAEQFIRAHAAANEITVKILRPFSIYGPGMSPLSLIGTMFRQVQCDASISLYDLRPIRDYCHVADLVRAIELACTNSDGGVLTLNIGSGEGISVKALANTLLETVGRDIPIREITSARRRGKSEILELVADISRARSALNWFPGVTLREGLRDIAMTALKASELPVQSIDSGRKQIL